LLRQCIEQGRLRIGKHFRDELRADSFDINQALSVMRSGNIFDAPECDIKTGEWKYRIEGYEPEGRCIAIVFCFKPPSLAFLITAFEILKR
jgi:hypothetical protein